MSVRIYELSKKIGLDNKELLDLLRERGFQVKTASSVIDNISADSIIEEFEQKGAGEGSEPAASDAADNETPEAEASGSVFPAGVIVKTAEQIEAERKAAAEAAKPKPTPAAPQESNAASAPAPPPPPPPPPPTAGRPPATPPVPPASKPPAPPPAATAPKSPPVPEGPVVKQAGADEPASAKAPSEAPKPPAPPPARSAPPPPPAASAPPPPPGSRPPAPAKADEAAGETEAAADTGPKVVHVKPPIVVRDFAGEIGLKPFKLISELMELGIFASMNQTIEESVAQQVAQRHGVQLEIHHRGEQAAAADRKKKEKVEVDESALLEERPPVVCIMGHVDHGKTTLLDTIRKTSVVSGEAGGITQHVSAYQVEHNDRKISFIDTPGHAAFSGIRERGANLTDVIVLVVAADDGFMPQTEEALKFAQRAQGSVIVAINKTDVKGANVDKVKKDMQDRGIAPEDWGGDTICVPISALKGDNIDELLEMILLQAEVMELRVNPKADPEGVIIESQIEQGRGATATVLIQRGTLKVGDALVCGETYCKVKSIVDDRGKTLKNAPPSAPVKVVGWSSAPPAGLVFKTCKNEREAKRIAEEAMTDRKRVDATPTEEKVAATVDDLFAAIESSQKKSLQVILKADAQGSLEALRGSLEAIDSERVGLKIVGGSVGMVTKNDVTLASASDTAIVAFNVKLDNGVQGLAKHHEIRIFQHNIIYELIDMVEDAMTELLDAESRERKLGAAEVRAIFGVGKGRNVAGCMVTEGTINRDRMARVVRAGEVIYESKIDTLKRFKDDVTEVRAGYECGIKVQGYDDYEEGDVIECFEVEKVRPQLR